MPERGVRLIDDLAQRLGLDLAAGEARDDVERHIRIRLVGKARDLGGGELRPRLWQVQPAVAGEAGQNGVGEAEHRCAAARGNILHQGETSGSIAAHPSEIATPGQVSWARWLALPAQPEKQQDRRDQREAEPGYSIA